MGSLMEEAKEALPLIVLDLDLTLWRFQVDKLKSPFMIDDKTGKVADSLGVSCECFPNALESLQQLKKNGFPLAIASRITDISGAYQLLHLFDISQFFAFKTVYPGSKVKHFKHLHAASGIELKNMIFFDDDKRNIRDVSRLGVFCVLVTNGLSIESIKESLRQFYLSRGVVNANNEIATG